MNHPTPEQVQVVIDNLKKAAALENRAADNCPVDMHRSTTVDHRCGTPLCHAGWYAMIVPKDKWVELDFEDGAQHMAHDLGFLSMHDLIQWAKRYARIWGNRNGVYMFSSKEAFGGECETLQDIINHWEGVKRRLEMVARIYLKNNFTTH